MRVTLVVLAVALAASGCRTRPLDQPLPDDGGLSSSTDLASSDLSRPTIFDFSMPPVDLARLGCAALAQCVAQCQDQQCFNQCQKQSSGRANMQLDAALGCGQEWCLGQNGGPTRCVVDPTGQNFADAPGVPPGDCNVCLGAVFTQLFGVPCSPPNDSACMPTACKTPYEVCLNN